MLQRKQIPLERKPEENALREKQSFSQKKKLKELFRKHLRIQIILLPLVCELQRIQEKELLWGSWASHDKWTKKGLKVFWDQPSRSRMCIYPVI